LSRGISAQTPRAQQVLYHDNFFHQPRAAQWPVAFIPIATDSRNQIAHAQVSTDAKHAGTVDVTDGPLLRADQHQHRRIEHEDAELDSSHLSLISHPREIANLILQAAGYCVTN